MTKPLRILLPFSDDSTLFFAARMRAALTGPGWQTSTAWLCERTDLSERQLFAVLPDGPDILLRNDAFNEVTPLRPFDAIVTSRIFIPLREMIRRRVVRYSGERPCIVAFQGGLEFDPVRGFRNRRDADAVFVVPRDDLAAHRKWADAEGLVRQYLGFGHPTFVRPQAPADPADRRDIYFFAQAISPPTRRGRMHILRVLAAIARANPDRTVWLKLRHLPQENRAHLHIENFAYPDLLASGPGPWPENLRLTADPMDRVLDRAAVGITCTSTAAVDLVRAGVPTLVYLDFVENYLDPMIAPMRRLFGDSGLIAPLQDVLNLAAKPPDPAWLDRMFCTPAQLAAQIAEAVEGFRRNTGNAPVVLPPLPHGTSGSS